MKAFRKALRFGAAGVALTAGLLVTGTPAQAAAACAATIPPVTISINVGPNYSVEIYTFINGRLASQTATQCVYNGQLEYSGNGGTYIAVPSYRYTTGR